MIKQHDKGDAMILVNIDSLSMSELRNIAQQEGILNIDNLDRDEIISELREKYADDDDDQNEMGSDSNLRYLSGITDYREIDEYVPGLPGVEELPAEYPDTEIHLLLRSSTWAYCYWQISQLDSDRIGLCYDPSHLIWQFIDPYSNIFRFKEKIFRFHAKDTHVDMEKLSLYGVQQYMKWWQHRLPGLGDLDWNRIVDDLYQIGYDDAIVIEHEDPVWEGTLEKVEKGILKTRDHVSQYFLD